MNYKPEMRVTVINEGSPTKKTIVQYITSFPPQIGDEVAFTGELYRVTRRVISLDEPECQHEVLCVSVRKVQNRLHK